MINSVEKDVNLNRIIDEMHQKFGKDDLTELEKARYLYIELGKLFRYKMDYLTLYKRKQEDIYFDMVDYDDIRTNSWICVQMSDIYVEALKRIGISASTQKDINGRSDYSMPHKYTVINLSDGRNIVADLIYDLPFIQLGMKTGYFGTNSENNQKDVVSEEEIKSADDKIGYTFQVSKKEYAYTETFLEMIKQELADPEKMKEYVRNVYDGEEYKRENLIEYKLDLIGKFLGLENMGFYEGSKVLAMFYRDFFTDEERKKLSFTLLRKEPYENHHVGNVEEIACYCFKKTKDSCKYYIYEEGKGLIPITRDDIKEKIKTYDKIEEKNFDGTEYGDDIFV